MFKVKTYKNVGKIVEWKGKDRTGQGRAGQVKRCKKEEKGGEERRGVEGTRDERS